MNDTERDTANYLTALQGEQPNKIGDREIRRVSLETVSILQLVGSPFAPVFNAAMNNEEAIMPKVTPVDVAVLAWIHGGDPDEVLNIALQCAPDFATPAIRAALQFVRKWSPEDMARVVEYAIADTRAIKAASFDVAAPDYPGVKKK